MKFERSLTHSQEQAPVPTWRSVLIQ